MKIRRLILTSGTVVFEEPTKIKDLTNKTIVDALYMNSISEDPIKQNSYCKDELRKEWLKRELETRK